MASGLPPLLTLVSIPLLLVVYRLWVIHYGRRRLSGEEAGYVDQKTRSWWRLGAASILILALIAMFLQLLFVKADLVSPVVDSVELGVIYTILGIGLTLTFAVVKLPNFAYGEIVTTGAYVMAITNAAWQYPLPISFAAAAGAGAGVGLLQHLLVYRPLLTRGAKIVQIMIASFALSLMLRSLLWILAAIGNLAFYHPITRNVVSLSICGGQCRLGTAAITDLLLWLLPTTTVLIILMHLLLTRTLIGKSMRAIADNVELSQVTGINVEYVRQITWLLTGALAGLGGAFLGIAFPITPELGWTSLLRVFAAVTLGGLVSFYGTIAGGIIVGFAENWVTIIGATNYGLSTSWQPFTAFLIIVIVLLVRPAGFSGLTLGNPLASLRNLTREYPMLRVLRRKQTNTPIDRS